MNLWWYKGREVEILQQSAALTQVRDDHADFWVPTSKLSTLREPIAKSRELIAKVKRPTFESKIEGTSLFDNWLRTVPVYISIEAKEDDDARVQSEYSTWTNDSLTDALGNPCIGYSIYRGGENAVASRYGTIFRMKFPAPPEGMVRPEFISRFHNPIEYVTLKDGRVELAATDYIKYLLCRGFRVGNNTPQGDVNGNYNQAVS